MRLRPESLFDELPPHGFFIGRCGGAAFLPDAGRAKLALVSLKSGFHPWNAGQMLFNSQETLRDHPKQDHERSDSHQRNTCEIHHQSAAIAASATGEERQQKTYYHGNIPEHRHWMRKHIEPQAKSTRWLNESRRTGNQAQ